MARRDPDNVELAGFLRSRRARVEPEQVGVPSFTGQPRRVPGLRREEVAFLAGVSVDYYTRLERGRAAHVSAEVLDAVARALRMDVAEREHLFAIAGSAPRPERRTVVARQTAHPQLLLVLDQVVTVPALVLGQRMEVLAINDLGRAFYTDFDALPPDQRSIVRFLFFDDRARDLYVDWSATARAVVAELRRYADTHQDDGRLAELVGELSVRDSDFRRWWADHNIYRRAYGAKDYRHPVVGELSLGYQVFIPAGISDQVLGVHTVEAGSRSEQALRLLASWTQPGFTDPSAVGSTLPSNN